MTNDITIRETDPGLPDIQKLISELDEYQASLYPPESNHLEPLDKLRSPAYYFIAAWQGRILLGIGSFKRSSEDYVEIKRLMILREHRGKGLAIRLMKNLEAKAAREGFTDARLETGIYQQAALGLYQRLGYQKTGPFGTYKEDPLSVFMGKRLG